MNTRWTHNPLRLWELLVHWFFAGSCWQDQMYMELVFNCLSQAICLILPAVFIKKTSLLWLLFSLNPFWEGLRCVCQSLSVSAWRFACLCCWQKCCLATSFVLVTPAVPAQAAAGAGFHLRFALPVEPLCMWSICKVAPQQRRRVADVQRWGNSCSLRRAASPDPVSDPKGSLQISLVVRKPLMGKSLGDIHWPYLFSSSPRSYCWVGIVYLLPPSLPEKHFWKANTWFWKLRIKGTELLNNLSLYKMYVAMHVLTCFVNIKIYCPLN